MTVRLWMRVVMAGLVLVVTSTFSRSWAQCEAVLTETGRNYMSQINIQDQRAWYYKNICHASSTGIGATGTYSNFAQDMLSQANSKFGFNYNSVSTYCSSEASSFANYTYSNTQTSSVMASSTSAWLQCIELTNKGIIIKPTITSQVVAFDLRRGPRSNAILNGVTATAGFRCKATIQPRRGKNTQVDLSDNSIGRNYRIADVDAMTVLCSREPLTDSQNATYYPGGTVTLVTSEGSLVVQVPADTLGKEAWASQVVAAMAAQDARIATLDTYARTARRVVPSIRGAYLRDNTSALPMGGANSPQYWYYTNTTALCDPETVMVSAKLGATNLTSVNALGVSCVELLTVP